MRCTFCDAVAANRPNGWVQVQLESNSGPKYFVACPDESPDAVAKAVRDKLADMRGVIKLPPPIVSVKIAAGKRTVVKREKR